MSKHLFKTSIQNRPVAIELGWDKADQNFYLLVQFEDSIEEDEGVVYFSDDDRHRQGPDKSLQYYRAKLALLGVALPESMFLESLDDRAHNRVNRFARHQTDGSFSPARGVFGGSSSTEARLQVGIEARDPSPGQQEEGDSPLPPVSPSF